jgi:hypothetical protein
MSAIYFIVIGSHVTRILDQVSTSILDTKRMKYAWLKAWGSIARYPSGPDIWGMQKKSIDEIELESSSNSF